MLALAACAVARADKRMMCITLPGGACELPAPIMIDERLSETAPGPFVLIGATATWRS